MTYGVPYSFVPGTKAKADEVNANFIDILDKIQTTNGRIDTANTTLQECSSSLATKLNVDLSNISEEGEAMFDGMAYADDLDGNWTEKYTSCAVSATISVGATQSYTLTNALPDDDNIYEVMIAITAQTAATSGATAYLFANTDKMTSKRPLIKVVSRHSSVMYATNACTLIVGAGRKINISNSSNSVGVTTYDFEIYAYRKVR